MSKKGGLSTDSYKGVRDFYPEEQAILSYITATMRRVAEQFGYVEYHASVLEPAELYKSKGAENEEMVNEQTYTFTDRGGREVTLRPEMTPTVARMVAAKRREFGFPLRLYSIPNLFRYERPQRGRLREHWQLNVDLFGSHSLAADAEIILVAHAIMTAFGAKESDFVIKVGSRNFLDSLTQALNLSPADAKKLRGLLDRRGKMAHDDFVHDITDIGVGLEMLSAENPPEDVAQVLKMLGELGVTNAVFDPSIVRGFDYYTGIVFELFDTHPENNRSLFGGGRYDNLTTLFDSEPTTGVGFGMGDATMQEFLRLRGLLPAYLPPTHIYLAVTKPELVEEAMRLAGELRSAQLSVAVDLGEKKLSDQIKTATKHKIPRVVVVGEDEIKQQMFKVRMLETGEDVLLSRADLAAYLKKS